MNGDLLTPAELFAKLPMLSFEEQLALVREHFKDRASFQEIWATHRIEATAWMHANKDAILIATGHADKVKPTT